jgi:hypothetical protein
MQVPCRAVIRDQLLNGAHGTALCTADMLPNAAICGHENGSKRENRITCILRPFTELNFQRLYGL